MDSLNVSDSCYVRAHVINNLNVQTEYLQAEHSVIIFILHLKKGSVFVLERWQDSLVDLRCG
jgi:hypothetical protein